MKFKPFSIILLGCVLAASSPGLFAQAEKAAQLLAQGSNGILFLVAYDSDQKEVGKGTAFAVAEDAILTNYHLISLAAKVVVFNVKKKEIDIRGVYSVNKELDLALLQTRGKIQPLPMGGEALKPDQTVYVLGSNEIGEFSVIEGKVKKLFDIAPETKLADLIMTVPDSFSGAAVLDENGKVSGLLNVFDKRLKFVIPTSALSAMAKGTPTAFKAWKPEDYYETIEASWLSGRMFAWINESYGAQKGLERVTKAQPDNLEAWTLLAGVYDTQRDYANATTTYQKIIGLDPNNAAAYAGLGQIQARMQRYADAAGNLEKAIQLNPADKTSFLFLGNAYEGGREWVKAAEAYRKYVASNPADAWQAYQMMGNCLREAERFDEAAAAFAEAVKAKPEDITLNYNLAQMLERAKKYDEAEAVFVKMAEAEPKDAANFYSYILRMYDQANMTEKAIIAAQKIIELEPKNEQAQLNLGFMYTKIQKYPEAIAAFKASVAIKPDYDLGLFQLGYIYYLTKAYKEAIPVMRQLLELTPDNASAWMLLGICHMQIKQFDPALEPMKRSVDLQPDNTDSLFNLGVIYLNLKDRHSAEEIAKKLQPLDAAKAAKLRSYFR